MPQTQNQMDFGASMASHDLDTKISVPFWSHDTKDFNKLEADRGREYIKSLKQSYGDAAWHSACRATGATLKEGKIYLDNAIHSFWKHHPPVPKKSQFSVGAGEESSSEESSVDGSVEERPTEPKESHEGEKVPEPSVPEDATGDGSAEWGFLDLTDKTVIPSTSSS